MKEKAEKAGDKVQEKATEAKDKAGSAIKKAAGKVNRCQRLSQTVDGHGLHM